MSREERIAELTAKINDAKKRFPEYDEIDWDNILNDELRTVKLNMPMWETELKYLQEELKKENVVAYGENLSVEEINSELEKNKEKRRELWEKIVSAGDEATPEEKAELKRLDDIIKELEERLKQEKDISQEGERQDDSSIKDIDALIAAHKEKRRELWEKIVSAGDEATPEEKAELKRLDDIIKGLEELAKENEKMQSNQQETNKKDTTQIPGPEKNNSDKNKEDDARDKFAKGGFKPPAVVNTEKQPPAVRDLPELNLRINKKTGECILTDGTLDEKGNLKVYETQMDSYDYTRVGLSDWRDIIGGNENISDVDKEYLNAVDPTIYNAYLEYDRANEGKYNASAAEMYVSAVIAKARELKTGENAKDVKMPGNVEVDIGWHPNMEDKRSQDVSGFKKLKYVLASHRANKILKNHGASSFFKQKMELAKVKDNRGLFAGLASGLAVIGATAFLSLNAPEKDPKVPDTEPKIEHDSGKDVSENEIGKLTGDVTPEQETDKDNPENVEEKGEIESGAELE